LSGPELSPLIEAINSRSARLRQRLEERGTVVIDVSHGEMRFTMHPQVQAAVLEDTRLLLAGKAELLEPDGQLFDKSQPRLLRRLVADRLYHRWRKAGLPVTADEVLVCPYSSLAMLDAVLASVARPGGVILCPEGFYKSNFAHIEKLGLVIRLFPVDLDRDGRVQAWHLRRAIQAYREQLCALLLTMPGNPLVAVYTAEELHAIGRVLVEEGIRVIIDAAFDGVVPDYQPLGTVEVDIGGARHSLYERTATITGLSKGHHAIGPYKIGAAITGDAGWRADIRRQLTVPFQRETTVLARTVLEQTPEEFLRCLFNNEPPAGGSQKVLCGSGEEVRLSRRHPGRIVFLWTFHDASPGRPGPAASRSPGRLAAGRLPPRRSRAGDGGRTAHGHPGDGRPHQRGRTPDRSQQGPDPPG
jgi:aspartate/methionine/tyrosine aminotransferase